MNIQVKSLLSKEKLPITFNLPEDSNLKQVREALEDQDVILMVNGVVRPDNYRVTSDDVISVMPILMGG